MAAIERNSTVFNKARSCRYGMNPGGPAAHYEEEGASGPCTAGIEVLQEGKGLGYINIADMDLAIGLTKSLHDISNGGNLVATIAKHEMPSGVARGSSPLETYETAWQGDELSSFGGVVALSYEVTPEIAEKIVIPSRNTEVLTAPSYAPDSLKKLKEREDLRVIKTAGLNQEAVDDGIDFKRLVGAFLMEKRVHSKINTIYDMEVVSRAQPTPEDMQAALFLWHVARYTRSNAIIIGDAYKVHGIGSGQRSRIDAGEDSVRLSMRGFGPENTFMASDAYMPEDDVAKLAVKYRIRGIVYPLGSKADQKVIDYADDNGLILIATRKPGEKDCERCFTHR
ncbi:MAG: hypothetical protein ABIE22_03195, partial [archaeon]